MGFKFNSKNTMGVMITLILIILLSQSRVFDFLIDTALGRMILLSLIIFIAYTNKILGLVAVLFVIIIFNENIRGSFGTFFEGFDVSKNSTEMQKGEKTNELRITPKENATNNSKSVKSIEGFCMTDRETNILRGKQSNTVPVFNNLRGQSDDVSPYDNSEKSSGYALF
jgi:hypothetical protein